MEREGGCISRPYSTMDSVICDTLQAPLRQVAGTDIGAQIALIGYGVVFVQRDVEWARSADAHHHYAHLPARGEVAARMPFLTARVTDIHDLGAEHLALSLITWMCMMAPSIVYYFSENTYPRIDDSSGAPSSCPAYH